ncbi:helix-turn-helix domain-containing protein [Streptomyces albireticuli]|uniref:helix-turn-helix domain-containing protein n=1 Tax=Streptomyces albireticuli TaxID=1940 RepID=UPI000BAA9860|nr:helix-turn-helix transcriptional regulator [Streptomyces albireticuli]MCD9146013.1 helix-turn-helix domain-containing protein [Streptomyces albireticuli]MCD9166243.1 helix-turn-helix domain-containing protein [Streptomyces albireticuli]MCD9196568.1 helix-turn-helix domain-containing protein [Streptomyces albireticuli]
MTTSCTHTADTTCPACNSRRGGRPPAEIRAETPELRTLIEEVRNLHTQRGITRKQLAKAIYSSESTISRDLSGARYPSWGQIKAIVISCGDEKNLKHWQQLWQHAQIARIRNAGAVCGEMHLAVRGSFAMALIRWVLPPAAFRVARRILPLITTAIFSIIIYYASHR